MGLLSQMWLGQAYETNAKDLRLSLPSVQVLLRGDFVWVGPDWAEDRVLDGDNIGGRVGLAVNRPGPIQGGRNPSGDLAQGGDFESWFFLSNPIIPAPGITHGPVHADPRAAMLREAAPLIEHTRESAHPKTAKKPKKEK
jgi:hypothetical protein